MQVLSIVVLPLLLMAESAKGLADETNRVICPAIDQDEAARTDYPFDSSMVISIVAQGNVREQTQTNPGDQFFELTVEDFLYGSCNERTVRFSYPWSLAETNHVIVALVPTLYVDPAPFELKYDLPGGELKSQRALARARLDYRVLSSHCIFIGKETAITRDLIHTVEVVRSLYGPVFRAGEKLAVQTPEVIRNTDRHPQICSNEMIYLIGSVAPGSKLYGLPPEVAKETIYTMTTRLGVDQETGVREALKRRDSYPMVEMSDTGRTLRCREVMFDGNISEAISLLGSASDAAVTLGVRKLKNTDGVLSAVVSAVEKDLSNFTNRPDHGYRRLHNLILLLGEMGQGSSQGEISKLLDKLLGRIESTPPFLAALPERNKYEYYWSAEEEHDDANHALAWLLMAMKEDDVIGQFAQRTIRLRDHVSGPWKQEVQLALDAARVEDNLEIQAAKTQASKTRPLRITPAIPVSGEPVAFSHDGRFLACGSTVWKVDDWSKAGGFDQEGSIERVLFSKDDKFLYVVGGGGGMEIHNRFDWRTGKLDKAFEGHHQGVFFIALTPDDRQMLTASFFENVIHLWDSQSGKIIKSFDLPHDCFSVALSPDGTILARQSAPHEITIQRLAGGADTRLRLPDAELCGVTFSPDGNYFLAATFGFASGVSMQQVVHLFCYDVAAGFKLIANTTQAANRCQAMAVSSDSKCLVFGDQEGRAWTASLPDLKTVKPLITTKGVSIGGGRIAFSPDGKLLALGSFNDAIHLFNAQTFEPVQVSSGHTRNVSAVYFSNDGKTLRSLGMDNMVCSWDVASGEMKGRFSLPKDTTCVSVRPPDGRYALCASAPDVETPFWDSKKKVPPVKVVDLGTGKVISEVDLPVNWSFTATKVLWLREPEALCLADGKARLFNYLTGELMNQTNLDFNNQNILFNGNAEVDDDDGQTLYSISGGYKSSRVALEKSEITKWESAKLGEAELPSLTGNARGLVPGGKYFFVGNPGLYIYDRNPVKLAAQKRLKGWDPFHISFSSQGSYCAFAALATRAVDDNFTIHEPDIQTIIRVQETLTGKTAFAFPTHSKLVSDIKFSPNAERLAVVTDDGFVEIWGIGFAQP